MKTENHFRYYLGYPLRISHNTFYYVKTSLSPEEPLEQFCARKGLEVVTIYRRRFRWWVLLKSQEPFVRNEY
jgi:hypothetical protein